MEIVAKNVKEVVVIVGWKKIKWFVCSLICPTKEIAVMVDFLTIASVLISCASFIVVSQFSIFPSQISSLGAQTDESRVNM